MTPPRGDAPLAAPTGDLALRDVTVEASGRALLSGVDLDLRAGELCALVGPSGSGKSTLMRVLLGLKAPRRGTVALGGRPVSAAGPLGYVPQDDALHGALTVRQALDFAAELRLPDLPDAERDARVVDVTRRLGLDDRLDVRVKRLSGGQRKRVSVAMELLTSPPLLVLDEPTSGLDPGLEARSMALFAELAAAGRIVLVATHAMESLDRCDVLVVLVAGQIAYAGPPGAAPAWFGVEGYAGIFAALPGQTPAAWAQRWRGSAARVEAASRPRKLREGGVVPGRGSASAGHAPSPPGAAPAASPQPPPTGPAAAPKPDVHAQLAALKAKHGKAP